MRALDRKLLRDLWELRGQALAIAAVIAVGLAMFVAYLSTFESLRFTRDTYYDQTRFADVFASLERAPLSLRTTIDRIPGVAISETRIVMDVTLDVPGLREPATGRLISVGDGGPVLNALFLQIGRLPEADRPDEIVVSGAFADAHGLSSGSTLRAIINGRLRDLRVVGVALSPEFIYAIRPGEIFPDDDHFGILWMARTPLASAFDMEGAFNDVILKLGPGASLPAVIAELDRLLLPYGGLGAVPRSLQISNWTITNELEQLSGFGLIVPLIFLGVAALLLNVVLTRIVSVQRGQIATLKALGYSNRDLAWHYLRWSLAVASVGIILGIALGAWMGGALMTMYNDYFRFPVLRYRFSVSVALAGAGIGLTAAAIAALTAVKRAVRLPAAEAMRPEPPARYRRSIIERAGLGPWLSPAARLIVRNIERHPVRSLTSIVGIALGASMMVVGLFIADAVTEMMRMQFETVERQDVTVSFVQPRSKRALFELGRLPGVLSVEPVRTVPVRLRAGHRSRQIGLTGLVDEPRLRRIVDTRGRVVRPPPEGVVLTSTLATLLEIAPGDRLTIEVLEGRRPQQDVLVSGLVEEYLGIAAYMSPPALRRLLGEDEVLSGGYLAVDPRREGDLYHSLKTMPAVAGVSLKRAAFERFRSTMDQTMGVMILFNVLFAGTIAFGVVFNAARISLSERSRDLASLRVLGFTQGEIAAILNGELAVIVALGIPLGLAMGYGLAVFTTSAFETELYRFPVVVTPRTYFAAAAVTIGAAIASAAIVRRRLNRLDLIAVLKTRE